MDLALCLLLSWGLMVYSFFRFFLPASYVVNQDVFSHMPAWSRMLVELIFAVPFFLSFAVFGFFAFLSWGLYGF